MDQSQNLGLSSLFVTIFFLYQQRISQPIYQDSDQDAQKNQYSHIKQISINQYRTKTKRKYFKQIILIEQLESTIESLWKKVYESFQSYGICLNFQDICFVARSNIFAGVQQKKQILNINQPLIQIFCDQDLAINIEICPKVINLNLTLYNEINQNSHQEMTIIKTQQILIDSYLSQVLSNEEIFLIQFIKGNIPKQIYYKNYEGQWQNILKMIDIKTQIETVEEIKCSDEIWKIFILKNCHFKLFNLRADLTKTVEIRLKTRSPQNIGDYFGQLLRQPNLGTDYFLNYFNFDRKKRDQFLKLVKNFGK